MRTDQRRRRQVEPREGRCHSEAARGRRHLPLTAHAKERYGELGRRVGDDLRARLALTADHRRHGVLQNSGLLRGDALELVAEEARVVIADRCDGREHGIDHVGGVVAAAHADLDHREIGRHAREGEIGRDRGDLEEGDRLFLVGLLALCQHGIEKVVVDQVTGDPDALVEAHQMRRGVDVDAIARRLGHGAHVGDQGTLAVGAGDMRPPAATSDGAIPLRPAGVGCAPAQGRSAWDAAA